MDTGDDLCKPSTFALKTFPKPKSRITSSSVLISRPETPIINTIVKQPLPSSAPAAAGRSPTRSKRSGILSNRRTRLNAPVFGSHSRSSLSLAAAVNGTLASKKHKRSSDATTLEESKPQSWFFDIYEETDNQQDFVVKEWTMTQSACTLDISDDESKTTTREERGKENIPPNELHSTTSVAPLTVASATQMVGVSRKDMMTDEPRTPLGDLNPSIYYGQGLDATSVVLVAEDDPLVPNEGAAAATTATEEFSTTAQLPSLSSSSSALDFTFHADLPPPPIDHAGSSQAAPLTNLMNTSEINHLLHRASCSFLARQHDPHHIETGHLFDTFSATGGGDDDHHDDDLDAENIEPANPDCDIDIWESGSAKDEAAAAETDMDTAAGIDGVGFF